MVRTIGRPCTPARQARHFSEGFAPRQQHNNMESRKNIITKRGEGQCLSPQDRKAVTDIATFMELTEDCPSVNYPLCNLIPEIIAENNIISSFNRVIKNLRQSATDAEKKDCVVIDGNEYTRRQARYIRQKEAIVAYLKQSIESGDFRISKLTSFATKDGPKMRRPPSLAKSLTVTSKSSRLPDVFSVIRH